MNEMKSIEKQSKPIRELINYARERGELAKANPTRGHLIAALVTLGRSRRAAEREIDNARRRVRQAANKAEERLEFILRNLTLWEWTNPRNAIREMRLREFGGFENAPLTDIEEGLIQKGNVLWIIAVYPALREAIWKRLSVTKIKSQPQESRGLDRGSV